MRKYYLVCEDSGDGTDFWNSVNTLLLSNVFDSVTDCGSNSNLYNYLKYGQGGERGAIYPKDEDLVFVMWDNLAGRHMKPIMDDIANDKDMNFEIRYSRYSSLEELLLSFDELINWTGYTGEHLELYNTVKPKLTDKDDYYILLKSRCMNFLKAIGAPLKTKKGKSKSYSREQFAKYLYDHISGAGKYIESAHAPFAIKDFIASCWNNDCAVMQENKVRTITNAIRNRCPGTCKASPDYVTAKARLSELFEHSLFKMSNVHLSKLKALKPASQNDSVNTTKNEIASEIDEVIRDSKMFTE